jgi:hypothetical protein
MADSPIILLHPVREPLDQTAVGALELVRKSKYQLPDLLLNSPPASLARGLSSPV